MRRLAGRRETVAIDDPQLVWLCTKIYAAQPPTVKLWPFAKHWFGRAFKLLAAHFGLAEGDGVGITPASLRSGGATHLVDSDVPLDRIRWIGRWASQKMLEVYVQEIAASSVLPGLSASNRARIFQYAAGFNEALLCIR